MKGHRDIRCQPWSRVETGGGRGVIHESCGEPDAAVCPIIESNHGLPREHAHRRVIPREPRSMNGFDHPRGPQEAGKPEVSPAVIRDHGSPYAVEAKRRE